MRRTNQPSPQAACRTRPRRLGHRGDGGLDPPGVRPVQRRELDHAGARDALDLHLALELLQAVVDDVQGAAHRGGRLAHLVGDPPDVPEQQRPHALLDDRAGGALGLDRHHRVDEGGGVDHPQGLAEVAAAAGHRRVGQEQLVELALELGRQVARGPAERGPPRRSPP